LTGACADCAVNEKCSTTDACVVTGRSLPVIIYPCCHLYETKFEPTLITLVFSGRAFGPKSEKSFVPSLARFNQINYAWRKFTNDGIFIFGLLFSNCKKSGFHMNYTLNEGVRIVAIRWGKLLALQ